MVDEVEDVVQVLVIPAGMDDPVYLVSGPRDAVGVVGGDDEVPNPRATLLTILVQRRLVPGLLGDVVVSGGRDDGGRLTSVDRDMLDLVTELGWWLGG